MSGALPGVTVVAACFLVMSSCAPGRDGSSGSNLEGPRVWQATRDFGGAPIERWVSPEDSLPADTLSVTLIVTGGEGEVLSLGVRDSSGRVLVDLARPELSLNRLLRGRGMAVGVIPSGSATLPLEGNFSVTAARVADDPALPDEQPLSVAAWIKRSGRTAAVPEKQELPLTVFLVGDRPVADEPFTIALGEAGRIWRQAGISIQEPARIRVDGAEGARYDRLGIDASLGSDSPALGALLRLSDRAAVGTLALFVVADLVLEGSSGLSVWALSGAIPVPPQLGTRRSGIAVSGALIDSDPVFAGQVMAHEIGHALGLFHTTERELRSWDGPQAPRRALHDPLDDTPRCPLEADRDDDAGLTPDECEPHDASNLMFWAAARDGTRLSRMQAEMARRSALVR